MNDLILYTTEDGRNTIQLRGDQNTVWLTQLEMAELFDATKQNIFLEPRESRALSDRRSMALVERLSRERRRPRRHYITTGRRGRRRSQEFSMNDLILYTTEDGRSQIQLRGDQNTVWLTQLEMAELFDATKQNISLHLKNLFEDGELDTDSVVKESLTVQIEGNREVRRPVTLYNLDAILAVGYRVRLQLQYKPQGGVIYTARGNAPG